MVHSKTFFTNDVFGADAWFSSYSISDVPIPDHFADADTDADTQNIGDADAD